MMYDEQEMTLAFKPVSREPQLVMIPVDDEQGFVAIVKPYGVGQASCIAFAPATSRRAPFVNYRPDFLRKIVTTDFSLREGRWQQLTLDSNGVVTLKNAVNVLMAELERVAPEQITEIDLTTPANISSSPEYAFTTFRAPENVPFEVALHHLMGVRTPER